MKFNPKNASMFRYLVAAYLIYLGVNNLMHLEGTDHKPLIIGFSLLFIVFGAGYAFLAYKSSKNLQDEEEESVEEAQEFADEEPDAASGMIAPPTADEEEPDMNDAQDADDNL